MTDNAGMPDTTALPALPPLQWDIFCTVIDNYGDAGVCWRLASQLASRGQRVRLWIDQPEVLTWMAPEHSAVDVRHWVSPLPAADLPAQAGDVLIEAFGCELDDSVQAWWAQGHGASSGLWLNLEYLSAEDYVLRCHGLQSPVMSGPAAGCSKRFVYPGFVPGTGGLLRETGLLQRQQNFDRAGWRQQLGVATGSDLVLSLFCYEPDALPALLQQLSGSASPNSWLVFQGRGRAALEQLTGHGLPVQHGSSQLLPLPWLDQAGFDAVLWASDFNAVRGEDSLVRALWAGQPFVWHIYPQDDNAHHAKLDAFLDWLQAPADWRDFHHAWNSIGEVVLPELTPERLARWRVCALEARARLLAQPDLVSQLLVLAQAG